MAIHRHYNEIVLNGVMPGPTVFRKVGDLSWRQEMTEVRYVV